MSSNLNCRSFQSFEHREELQCQVEEDTAEKRVTKTVKILLVTSLGRCDDRMTAGVCPFRVIGSGKSETTISSSLDREHLEVLLDSAYAMAENRARKLSGRTTLTSL